jgi:hypothetical protein
MRSASVPAALSGLALALACSEPTSPPAERGPPAILALAITLDSAAQLGHFRVVASDPDGPVALECVGAFQAEGVDSLVLVRPFAELRLGGEYLFTMCFATEGDTTVSEFTNVGEYAIDGLPDVELTQPPDAIRVGHPSVWHLQVTDDWALAEYWFSIAPEPDCSLHWTRVGTWPGDARTAIDTLVTVTFPSSGQYCVVLGAQDDLGRNVGRRDLVEVLP